MQKNRVLILGSGVSGLTVAKKLLDAGHKVSIWSEQGRSALPNTSLNAYAMWMPVMSASDPRVERWANDTLGEFRRIASVPGSGVAMRTLLTLKVHKDEPWYATRFAGFRHALPGEVTAPYVDADVLDPTPIIDPAVYLPLLRLCVAARGASFVKRTVSDIAAETRQYPIVVNCTGLGARSLLADTEFHPERMQLVTIKHNGFNKVLVDSDGPNARAAVVPHRDYIKLGAIADNNGESLEIDENGVKDILRRCSQLVPEFKPRFEDVLSVARGVRPVRSSVRVEEERLADGRLVIHNYGHGGMGYILSRGIANDIARMVTSV